MRAIFAVADPVCMDALRKYAGELSAVGLPVRIEEVPIDDGWTHETAVSIEWGPTEEEAHDWEFEEDEWGGEGEDVRPSPGRGLDDAPSRLAEHYLRTMQFLARNVDAARASVAPARRPGKKK